MGQNSKIQWTHHTFNPWRGCTKVSPGCQHCYAETLSKRNSSVLGEWGPQGKRIVAAESMWREPVKWNRQAQLALAAYEANHEEWLRMGKGDAHEPVKPERPRVFCASLADVFEGPETMPAESVPVLTLARKRLGKLITDTPCLDWLLLTKRPENVLKLSRDMWIRFDDSLPLPPNVWLGVSVEDQQRADERIPLLLQTPAAVRFLSVEPLLGPVDLERWLLPSCRSCGGTPTATKDCYCGDNATPELKLHWCIVGGESGHHARPCDLAWIRSLVQQCKAAGVACFVKQLGANYADPPNGICGAGTHWPFDVLPSGPTYRLKDPKGGEIDEFPPDLRIRELPHV